MWGGAKHAQILIQLLALADTHIVEISGITIDLPDEQARIGYVLKIPNSISSFNLNHQANMFLCICIKII